MFISKRTSLKYGNSPTKIITPKSHKRYQSLSTSWKKEGATNGERTS